MKYYKILYNDSVKYKFITFNIDEKSLCFNRYDLDKGNIIEPWNNQTISVNIDYSQGAILEDWVANNMAWPMISEKFKNIIENTNCGENIRFLPIEAFSSDERQSFRVYIINNTSKVDALDEKNSKILYHLSNGVPIIAKHALIAAMIGNLDIFKLTKDPHPLFVSDKVAKLVEKYNLTGMELLPIKAV